MLDFIVLFLTVGIPLSSALLLASLGETVNQRSGVFNLGCEGVMSMGAFVGMFIPYMVGGSGKVAWYVNVSGLLAAAAIGALLGLLFGVVVIKFGAPQGIAGIGLQLFGTGLAGSFYRHFIGGAQGVAGIDSIRIPVLSDLPIVGKMLFSCNPMVYFAFLMVPVVHYILFKTPWGLKVRACGTFPRAADSMGIDVSKTRYQALAFGSAMAALAGAYLSLCCEDLYRYPDRRPRLHRCRAGVFRTLVSAGRSGRLDALLSGSGAAAGCAGVWLLDLPVRVPGHAAVSAGRRRSGLRRQEQACRSRDAGQAVQPRDAHLSGIWHYERKTVQQFSAVPFLCSAAAKKMRDCDKEPYKTRKC